MLKDIFESIRKLIYSTEIGQLAATSWRSKFGRPSKLPTLGDVDPTGTYCHLTEDWLKKKYGRMLKKIKSLLGAR